MIFMASPFKRYYITVIILIATSNFEKALSFESNEERSREVAYDFITKIEEADKNTPSASKPPHPEPSTNPPFLTFPPNNKPKCLANDETCVPLWQRPPNDSLKCCKGLICKKSPIDQMPAKFECVKGPDKPTLPPNNKPKCLANDETCVPLWQRPPNDSLKCCKGLICKKSPIDQMPAKFECVKGPDKPTQNPSEKPTCAVEKKSCGSKVKGGTVCCDGLQCCRGKNCGTPFRGKCVKKQENTCAATSEPCGRKFKGEADCCDELECCQGKKCGQSVFKGVCKEKLTCAAKNKFCGEKFKGEKECCEGFQCCKGKNNCENVWRGKCIWKAQ